MRHPVWMAWTSLRNTGVRWLRRGLIVLAATYALYLMAGNAFLNTALGARALNAKPERFQMHWSSGRTWWPGRVSLRDVVLRGQSRRLVWETRAMRLEGRIALWPLLSRRLHVSDVRADEVHGGVRRVERDLVAPPARAGGWELQFDRIVSASVRRAYFDGLVLEGDGTVQVGFYKQLRGGPMALMPSVVRFRQARLAYAGAEVVREADAQVRFAMDRHRRDEAAGIDKLLKTELAVALKGKTSGVDITIGPDGKGALRLVPGTGMADLDVVFARGRLAPGSRVRWSMPLGGHDATGATRRDALGLALAVDRDIVVKATMPRRDDGRMSLDADLTLRGNDVPLKRFASLLPRASGHVVGDWHFSSLRWLSDMVAQAGWLSFDGAGDVHADVRVAGGRLAAGSRIAVPGVDAVAEVMGNRVRGRARAELQLDAGAQDQLIPRLQVVMEHFQVASSKAPAAVYVQGRDLRLSVNAAGDPARLRDTLEARVTFAGARVPDLRVYNAFLPSAQMRFDGGAGTLSGDLSLDAAGEVGHGTLRVAGRGARMHLAGMQLRGDIDLDLKLRRADLKQRAFVADGSTLRLGNIGFTEPGGESRRGWWARIRLDRARLDVDSPASASGGAEVTMRDVGFLLALFSRQKEYPAWVYKLVDAGQAQVRGRVHWRGDTLVLDRMRAVNDRYEVLARLRLQGAQRQGDLYARWRALSLGVEMRGAQRRFHPVGAKTWYDGRPHYLR